MESFIGAVRLDDIIGGTLLAGVIPLSRFRRTQARAENAGAVTVLGVATEIVPLDLGTVGLGDLILIEAKAELVKGVTLGTSRVWVEKKVGTASIVALNNAGEVMTGEPNHPASSSWMVMVSGIFEVTGAGTLTIRSIGDSAGSSSNVAIGAGELHATVIRDS